MKQLSMILVGVAALVLLLPASAALGQQPGPTTVAEKRFEAADPPAQAEVQQVVLDFAPGAWTPTHTHGGDVYVMVLEGAVTLRQGGREETFRAGEGWIDSRDEPHAAGNGGATTARLVATFVLPRGATPTTVVETGATGAVPPGPTTVAQFRGDLPALSRPLDVIQRALEFAPGVSAAVHT
ncbi:MAG: cupin domain-containing protein, partial [Chloroflexota bacterium]|nr:cupin domain-containing protein [Chloroflexota bacterium]